MAVANLSPVFNVFPPVVILVVAEGAPSPSQVEGSGEVEDPPLAIVKVIANGHDGIEIARRPSFYDACKKTAGLETTET